MKGKGTGSTHATPPGPPRQNPFACECDPWLTWCKVAFPETGMILSAGRKVDGPRRKSSRPSNLRPGPRRLRRSLLRRRYEATQVPRRRLTRASLPSPPAQPAYSLQALPTASRAPHAKRRTGVALCLTWHLGAFRTTRELQRQPRTDDFGHEVTHPRAACCSPFRCSALVFACASRALSGCTRHQALRRRLQMTMPIRRKVGVPTLVFWAVGRTACRVLGVVQRHLEVGRHWPWVS